MEANCKKYQPSSPISLMLIQTQRSCYPDHTMSQTTFNLGGITIIETQSESGSTWTIEDSNSPPSNNTKLVHEAGGGAAKVWLLGDSTFCKSKVLSPGTTLEHVTLKFVQNQTRHFQIPQVHHHQEYEGRYYIILSRVSGTTLMEAWPTMCEEDKAFCVARVADICTQMATWTSPTVIPPTVSGVDGNNLADLYLAFKDNNLQPEKLQKNLLEMGVDCSKLVFYHCDMGPGNILVDLENRTIAIIDWESAGWVPKEWIRTKFRISSGMDLEHEDNEKRIEFRKRVQLLLGDKGFLDIRDAWWEWSGMSNN